MHVGAQVRTRICMCVCKSVPAYASDMQNTHMPGTVKKTVCGGNGGCTIYVRRVDVCAGCAPCNFVCFWEIWAPYISVAKNLVASLEQARHVGKRSHTRRKGKRCMRALHACSTRAHMPGDDTRVCARALCAHSSSHSAHACMTACACARACARACTRARACLRARACPHMLADKSGIAPATRVSSAERVGLPERV